MSGPTWRIPDEEHGFEVTPAPRPLLVTGRAMRDALVRTWPIWVGAALAGALIGVGALFALPHNGSASTSLLMVHPSASDESAMTTDVNLLMTRKVADRVIAELDLQESPEAFLSSVTVEQVNNQILDVTVTAPDDAAALARTKSLVNHFLEFRGEQLRSISDGLIEGYQRRVTELRSQVEDLTREYDRLSPSPADQVRASDILATRATLNTQINQSQQAIEEAALETDAAITASHVIDEPVAKAFGSRRQMLLFGASGAILLSSLVIGTVLLRTVTSDRLRYRRDVASALNVPVRVGVGPVPSPGPLGRTWAALTARIAKTLRGHPVRWTERRRRRNLEALVQGLETALPPRLTDPAPRRGDGRQPPGRKSAPTTLGVAAIDRADTTAVVVLTLGERLAARGVRALLVDLSWSGALVEARATVRRSEEDAGRVQVHRPDGDPRLVLGPRRTGRRPGSDLDGLGELGAAWAESEVVLVLLEVDPGIDLDILRTWVNRIVPVVSAGRASRELLATVAGLIAQAGLEMPFALVEGTDRSDQTLGQPAPVVGERTEPEAALWQ